MASSFEKTFLANVREKKRKRSELLEALEIVKNVSLSDLSDLRSVLSQDDLLWLLKIKIPNALKLAEIVRSLPLGMPKAAKKTLLTYYFRVFSNQEDINVEQCVDLLQHCTEQFGAIQQSVPEVEILAPPTNNCSYCQRPLVAQNQMCTVTVFSLNTVKTALKLSCRCPDCKLNFGYSMFGNTDKGFRFYDEERQYIEASDDILLERSLCLLQTSLANHAWVSFVGFAESYNEVVKSSSLCGLPEELQQLTTKANVNRLDRKTVSSGFYSHEIEAEIRERGIVNYRFKGKEDDARDEFMRFVENKRRTENYIHPGSSCSPMCKERGCENFVSIDGIWKLRHPHCLYPVKAVVAGLPAINYPSVCTEEPETQASAFCAVHSQLAKTENVPTNLRQFIHDYCRVPRSTEGSDSSDINVRNAEQVNKVAANLPTDDHLKSSSAAEAQGTEDFIRDNQSILEDCDNNDGDQEAACNKDTGESQKTLRKWSRGLLHFVRGGGFIERWCPLYVSEGPGQVFLITIQYLLTRLKDIPEAQWEQFIVSYDNMCNLDKLRVARKPLPLPEPYDKIWLKVRKIVDRLHMRNHKNPECRVKYGSDDLKEQFPCLNTPVAEQAFVWSSRFKKIMCAMPKRRFLFFYHRMVIRRNNYVSTCYQEKRMPEFPSIH